MFTPRDQPLSYRGIERSDELLHRYIQPAVAGMSCDTSQGNPSFTRDQIKARFVTARITDFAYEADGVTPQLDDHGRYQYQWIEEQRGIDGNGFPAWQNADSVPMEDWRGSIKIGAGNYLHLAHEANGYTALPGDHVIMWAGVLDLSDPTKADWEHVFYSLARPRYAKVQSDWTENTVRPGDPYAWCKLCDTRHGDNERGNPFIVYTPRHGDLDPNVYGPHNADTDWPDYPGDVLQFMFDINGDPVTVANYVGERIGSRKAIILPTHVVGHDNVIDENAIPYGWKLCKGFTPADSKLGFPVPDMRGLFARCIETEDTLWGGGANQGPGLDHGNPGDPNLVGIASTIQHDTTTIGVADRVTNLENAPAYKPAAQPNLNEAVVCPPCWVEAFIIRVK